MATRIELPRNKGSLPHGGGDLVEKFVARSIPGATVKWRGRLMNAGVGIAYGYAPSAAEQAHAWDVARAVMALLPKRALKAAPVKCKSRCMSMGDAEAAAKARWGNHECQTPRRAAHE